MEYIPLSDQQLTYLAKQDPCLKPFYYGTLPCDGLPKSPPKKAAYIVNTDPHDQPGEHWMAVWTDQNVCEIMDSYALPLDFYAKAKPFKNWIHKHWKYVVPNGKSLQGLHSQACGHYALLYLKLKAEGKTLQDFLSMFSDYNRVRNDELVGEFISQWSDLPQGGKQRCKARYEP